jgi:tetrahydromethanopterin S-methyltransferase subunit E
MVDTRVVSMARIARQNERVVGTGFAHEFALVAETGVAMRAQSKLELGALLGTLVFGEVHEGNVWTRVVSNIVVAPLSVCVGVIPSDVALLIRRECSSVFVILPATIVWFVVLATPFPLGWLCLLALALGGRCLGSRRHFWVYGDVPCCGHCYLEKKNSISNFFNTLIVCIFTQKM